jgi:hypothetical protein
MATGPDRRSHSRPRTRTGDWWPSGMLSVRGLGNRRVIGVDTVTRRLRVSPRLAWLGLWKHLQVHLRSGPRMIWPSALVVWLAFEVADSAKPLCVRAAAAARRRRRSDCPSAV